MFSADLGFGPPFTLVAEGVVEGIGQVVSMRILDVDVLEPPYTGLCSFSWNVQYSPGFFSPARSPPRRGGYDKKD